MAFGSSPLNDYYSAVSIPSDLDRSKFRAGGEFGMPAPGTLLQNRYRIIRLLGEGGMGAVYLARDERLKRDIALKECFFTDDGLRRAFEREALLLANLNHPALPRVMDHFTEGAGQFLVMDFIEGDDLTAMLGRRGGPFSVDEALQWADQLLGALEYLHSRRPPIIHRDIKPQNIKLTEEGRIVLLDFGLAKGAAWHQSQIATGSSVRGYTPSYAPIEQMKGTGTDARSDLYSLAATIYHLLTGDKPIDALTRVTEIATEETDPLPSANEINPHVPSAVAEVLKKAMAIKPDHRPATAMEMRRMLMDGNKPPVPEQKDVSTVIVGSPGARHTAGASAQNNDPATQGRKVEATDQDRREERVDKGPTVNVKAAASQLAGSMLKSVTDAAAKIKTVSLWKRAAVAVAVIAAVVLVVMMTWQRSGKQQGGQLAAPVLPGSTAQGPTFEFETVAMDSNGNITARQKKQARQLIEDLGGGVTLEMVEIPAGTFTMGSPETEAQRRSEEGPQHQVSVQSFYMGKFEVTQAQWRAVAGLPKDYTDLNPDPSYFKGNDRPVENVSWWEAMEFCTRLSRKTGRLYRLPTEAEWEYVCRAGTTTPFAFGETITPDIVNYDGNNPYGSAPKGIYQQSTIDVGSLGVANGFGLYDMHGNVWEWCMDNWHDNYNGATTDGSAWQGGDGNRRVLRGGSWNFYGYYCRAASRNWLTPDSRYYFSVGFRLVLVVRTR